MMRFANEEIRRGDIGPVDLEAKPAMLDEGDASGPHVGAANMLVDIGDHVRADTDAQYLAAIIESSDDAIISKNLDGIITSWNCGAQALFGYKPEEVIGKPVSILIPPERADEEPGILARLRRGERIDHYETIRRRKDGALVEISLTVSPIRNVDGKVVGASKIARDITERKRAQEEQRLIVNELKHRMRNTLATVQAIATRTLHVSERDVFVARLTALGRAHDLLTVENWNRAPLADVIGRTLGPFQDKAHERFELQGPENLWLNAGIASLLTMALHELATNAAKYGALSNQTGRVRLTWELVKRDEANRLRLCWTEFGGPTVKPPTRTGFGSFLVERVLKAEGGEVNIEYKPEGLVGVFEVTC